MDQAAAALPALGAATDLVMLHDQVVLGAALEAEKAGPAALPAGRGPAERPRPASSRARPPGPGGSWSPAFPLRPCGQTGEPQSCRSVPDRAPGPRLPRRVAPAAGSDWAGAAAARRATESSPVIRWRVTRRRIARSPGRSYEPFPAAPRQPPYSSRPEPAGG
jgi:hypothetical protein